MRRITIVAAAAALFVSAVAIPASAGKVHKVTEKFTDSFEEVIPAGEVCSFPVEISEDVKGSDTAWLDADDELLKAHITVNGTTLWSGPGGSAIEHWAFSGWFDPIAMTFSQAGNVFNVHKNGLVLHDKGLIIFDETTGEPTKIAGPHEQYMNGFEALCEAIG